MITITPDATPEPHWAAVFSAVDLPTARPEIAAYLAIAGVPAVCTVDGRPMVFRASPLVPAGEVWVINEPPIDWHSGLFAAAPATEEEKDEH